MLNIVVSGQKHEVIDIALYKFVDSNSRYTTDSYTDTNSILLIIGGQHC